MHHVGSQPGLATKALAERGQQHRVRRPRPRCSRYAETARRASSHSCLSRWDSLDTLCPSCGTRAGGLEATRQPNCEFGKLTDLAIEHQENEKRKRILVVDNQLSLALLKQLLEVHGYEILETPEGLKAIDIARDEQPDRCRPSAWLTYATFARGTGATRWTIPFAPASCRRSSTTRSAGFIAW